MFEGHDQSKNQGARPKKCSRVTSEVKVQGSRQESRFKGHDQRDNQGMMEGHVHSKKKGHDQRDNLGMIQGHVHSKKDKGHDQCSTAREMFKGHV